MPQLDVFIFFSQYFILVFSFLCFYIFIVKFLVKETYFVEQMGKYKLVSISNHVAIIRMIIEKLNKKIKNFECFLFTFYIINISYLLFLLNLININNLIYMLLMIQLYFNVIFLVPTIGHIKMYLVYKLGEKYYHYFAKNFVIIFLTFIFLLYLNMISFISFLMFIYLILLSILFVLGDFLFNIYDPKNMATSNFLFDMKINIVTMFCGLNLRVILTFLFSEECVGAMGINIFTLLKKSNEENPSFLSKISSKVVGFCKKLFGSFFNIGKNEEKSPVKEETVISKPEEKFQQQQMSELEELILQHFEVKNKYFYENQEKKTSSTKDLMRYEEYLRKKKKTSTKPKYVYQRCVRASYNAQNYNEIFNKESKEEDLNINLERANKNRIKLAFSKALKKNVEYKSNFCSKTPENTYK